MSGTETAESRAKALAAHLHGRLWNHAQCIALIAQAIRDAEDAKLEEASAAVKGTWVADAILGLKSSTEEKT